jgi:flagellar hook-associated protein 1 FlgK
MYISTFSPLQTALSGVEAAQEELQTTGNNIANAGTAGYTDESVVLGENLPLTLGGGMNGAGIQVGTGVEISSIASSRNQYLDAAYRTQNSVASSASTLQSYMNQLQGTLNEGSSSNAGISSQLSTFWSDWATLATDPSNGAAQQVVVNDGTTLAQSFNSLSQNLASIDAQATSQYAQLTGPSGQVMNDANSIAQLNTSISQAQAAGENDNQMIDARNQAIDDLSSLANVTTVNNSNGTVTVNFGDAAQPLVNGSTVNWPQAMTAAAGGTLGQLNALTGTPGVTGTIAQYSTTLDSVANQLITSVNSIVTNPSFFTGSSASTIAVNPAVSGPPLNVETTTTGTPGANDVALAVAGLSGGSPDQAYDSFVATIGSATQAAGTSATTEQSLATGIADQRQSVEGVDMNEEESNVIQEQQAYQASAQIMNAFNTMINSLITQVG